MTYHQTIIVGNLGRDPEMRQLPSGTQVCNMNIAVNETWNDRQTGERRDKTTWYRVAVWGRQAETVNQYLQKGSQVMVIGTVEARAYMNNAGEPAASLELRAQTVRFLSNRNDNQGYSDSGDSDYSQGNAGSSSGNYDNDFSPPPDDVDDIPF